MSGTSPASVLFSTDGYELAVVQNTTIPTGTRALLTAGSDGTNARPIAVDSSGRPIVVGAGTAGTPVGGVVTIQGISGGQPIPVSGSITATNAAVSTTGTSPPASASYTGGSVTTAAPTYTNGTMNALSLTTSGLLRIDGSGVTQPVSGTVTANAGTGNFNVIGTGTAGSAASGVVTVQGIASMTPLTVSASGNFNNASVSSPAASPPASATYVGGSVTTTAPTYTTGQMNALSLTTAGALRIDGSATTQPVSGTVTANAGTGSFNNAAISATGSAPPASASYTGGSVTTAAPTYTNGQMSALSLTTGGLLRIDGSGVTQPVSGTVTANIGTTNGLALDATLTAMSLVDNAAFTDGTTRVQPVGYIFDETAGTALTENDAAAARIDSKRAQIGVLEDATTRGVRATIKAASTAPVSSDTSLVVSINPNTPALSVVTDKSSTGTVTSVAASGTSVTLLASNSSRILATIYNEGTKTLYVKLGATASTSSYTIPIFQNSYWELPLSYTGVIDGIWASGATGNARITELT